MKIHEANVNKGFKIIESTSDLAEGAVVKNTTEVLRLRGGVSQGSDCDSDGVPGYMQGDWNDDDVMKIIRTRREVEDYPILTAMGNNEDGFSRDNEGLLTPRSAKMWVEKQELKKHEVKGGIKTTTVIDGTTTCSRVQPSSSGGIPVESVMVEDYVSSDEEMENETAMEALERTTVNRAARAAFAVNKHESEELINLRKKMMQVQEYMQSKGLSMADCVREILLKDREFNRGVQSSPIGRDEFGLHSCINIENSKIQTLKENSGNIADKVFAEMPNQKMKHKVDTEARTWSNVVKEKVEPIQFDYIPMPQGATVLSPPDDVLRKRNEKFKLCMVGTFSKGTHNFTTVKKFAKRFLEPMGMTDVFQKEENIFFFKFKDENAMTKAVSRGTLYVEKRPMLVRPWCINLNSNPITSMPLWVKLTNIPYCYWTKEGLSSIASVIGRPISADHLTSKLDILPFAKFCVEYKLGASLPTSIPVKVLDPVTEEKTQSEVQVFYPIRPLTCVACQSLGHTTAACPKAKRIWVQKNKMEQGQSSTTTKEGIETNSEAKEGVETSNTARKTTKEGETLKGNATGINSPEKCRATEFVNENDWTEVSRNSKHSTSRKKPHSPSESATPPKTFKKLVLVDEIEARKKQKSTAQLQNDRRPRKGEDSSPHISH